MLETLSVKNVLSLFSCEEVVSGIGLDGLRVGYLVFVGGCVGVGYWTIIQIYVMSSVNTVVDLINPAFNNLSSEVI